MTNHNKQKLQEQLLAEFDALDKLGRGIGRTVGAGAKAIGSVAGGVAGLGSAIKKGYQAGKQTVGGGGADVNTAQQKPTQQKPAQQKPAQQKPAQTQTTTTKNPQAGVGAALKRFGKGVAGADSYQYRQGTQAQQDAKAAGFKNVAQQAGDKTTTTTTNPKADAEAQRKAGLEKKLGTTGSQAAATNKNTDAVNKSIARNQKKIQQKQGGVKQSGISQGIDIAGANKGVANLKKQAGQTATKVPGSPSSTAKDVGKKAGVTTAKIGGQKVDLNDPKMKGLRAAIEKAAPGVISGVDKLQPADKEKLKKALA
jgi:hypothetical protein